MTKKIYALCEPGTRKIRYIGQSLDPDHRLKAHIWASKANDTHLYRWVRSVVAGGLRPNLVILHEVGPNETWEEEEVRYIRAARALGISLVNANDGGEGGVSPTPSTLAKMRECKLGPKNPNFGVPWTEETRAKFVASKRGTKHTEETKEKQRVSKLGALNPNFGRSMPLEQRIRTSNTLKGRVFSEEHCEKLRKPKPPFTPEHCAAISAGKRLAYLNKKAL